MATKKQQKRRQKRLVHGDPERVEPLTPRKEEDGETRQPQPMRGRRGREFPPATWKRSLRRGLVVVAIMTAVLMFAGPTDESASNRAGIALLQGLIGAAFFIPFDYWLTGFVYRRLQRQQGRR